MATTPQRLALGTMNFGGRTPAAEATRIVHRALERGVSVFDTANVYGDGASERILGEALGGRRTDVRIATKVGLLRRSGKVEGLSAQRLSAALDESLERLRTDYVDLYYLHAPDPSTSSGEILSALAPLLTQGRIRAWGVSNFASWQILELMHLADAQGMPRPAMSQVLYNLLVRQLEVEYFAFTRRYPIHTTVYNPLAGGLLARKPTAAARAPPGSRLQSNALYRKRYGSDRLFSLVEQLDVLVREAGLDLVTVAYAWLRDAPGVDSILAGPGTMAHLDAALDALDAVKTPPLPEALRKRLDACYRDFVGTDATYAR